MFRNLLNKLGLAEGLARIPLSQETQERLNVLFHGKDRQTAARSLSWFGSGLAGWPGKDPKDPKSLERIRFAVLKLSQGSLAEMEWWMDQARRDWRDVLVEAGFAHDVKAHESWFPDGRP